MASYCSHSRVRHKVIWGVRRKFVWTMMALVAIVALASAPASAHQAISQNDAPPITTPLRFKLAAERSLVGVGTAATGMWWEGLGQEQPSSTPERLAVSASSQFAVAVTDRAVASLL